MGQSIWCCHCLCSPFADKSKTPSCKLEKPGLKYLLTRKQASSRMVLLVPLRALLPHTTPQHQQQFSLRWTKITIQIQQSGNTHAHHSLPPKYFFPEIFLFKILLGKLTKLTCWNITFLLKVKYCSVYGGEFLSKNLTFLYWRDHQLCSMGSLQVSRYLICR